jgi:pyruvate/2-oxoglutarate dehydrogenase complex dihydrolipoamide dehydrogenase (E3) component
MQRYNLIVIGGGAGGLTVAAVAALLGARVALREKERLGGDCLHCGCVPSKALLRAAKVAYTIRTVSEYALPGVPSLPAQELKGVMDYVRSVQARVASHVSVERFTEFGVEVFLGGGRLRSSHEVEIVSSGQRLWGRHLVLATGSRPRIPPLPGLHEVGFLTSETVFACDRLPARLVVIGGGPIGTELGQAFCRPGSHVIIASASERILLREDADVAAVLAHQLRHEGVEVWDRARVTWVAWRDGRKCIGMQTPGGERLVQADEILVAAGRQPNIEGLGLEEVGVAVGQHGVQTDRHCRTTVPSIWAVGDVAGPPFFSHWANHQGRVVARNSLFPGSMACDYATLPWTTFTRPEVARVGLSEAEAQAHGIAYDRYTVPFHDNDRAVCDGEATGFAKVLTRKGTGKLLGAAIVHNHAGEMLSELVVAKKHRVTLAKLADAIHVYPTLSEVHRSLGEQYLLQRWTPRLRSLLTPLFRWLRSAAWFGQLQFGLLVALLAISLAYAQSPFVAELQTAATSYHHDLAQLDRIREGLERTIKTDSHIANLVALARVSFLWGNVRATTREEKLAAYDRGRQIAKRVVELEPRNIEGRFWYATNTARWGQIKGVVRSLFLLPTVQEEVQIMLHLDPKFASAYALAGNVYYEVPGWFGGGLKKAEEMFRKGLELDPHFTHMRVGLGKALLKQGRVAEARQELQAVLAEQRPSNPADWTLKDAKEARELLEMITAKSPTQAG